MQFKSTATGGPGDLRVSTSASTAASSPRTIAFGAADPVKAADDAVTAAVHSHIQAARALGRETITTYEIARALGLSVAAVTRAVAQLGGKGVRKLGS